MNFPSPGSWMRGIGGTSYGYSQPKFKGGDTGGSSIAYIWLTAKSSTSWLNALDAIVEPGDGGRWDARQAPPHMVIMDAATIGGG
jgi:hypothetical protein